MTVLPVERPGPMHSPFHPDLGASDHLSLDADELRLTAQPAAASQAREFTRARLRAWGLDELSDACVLVVSEMTTNAVKATAVPHIPDGYACPHPSPAPAGPSAPDPSAPDLCSPGRRVPARPVSPSCACPRATDPYPILLRLRLTTAGLFAEVWDSNDGTPRVTAAGQDDESGRGLLLVGLCADEWGHYRSPTGGKVVFGRWILPPSWRRPAVPPGQPYAYPRLRVTRG
ncbi:ATP-binding protein [Streptosporangium amethystogenes]|uniref:ATP-binding protein n=1 Tax=Streptosporangium amethystogenes TaxID=2002 RepID=UPI0004CA46E7|nr:ATP-binding protein [Streptosporangium amethystogenes]